MTSVDRAERLRDLSADPSSRSVQARSASTWNGRIGLPVALASHTAPGLRLPGRAPRAIERERRRPPGPDVADQLHAARRVARARTRSARGAVAEALVMMRAIHSPSKFWLVMTTMPRSRK